jgi:biofilm protein TabA
MKHLAGYQKLLLFFCFLILTGTVLAQDSAKWTKKSAVKWLHSNNWKNGLKLKPHASVNAIVFADQYHKNQAAWDKAIAFLRDSDLAAMKPGKYVIDGDNVYATITEGPTKTFEQSAWESHRKYTDLQYVIKGKEKIGVAPVAAATVIKPYNDRADAANYNTEGQYYMAEPGTFFLFFPGDAHRPDIKVDGYDVVKKLVIKIKVVE